jgi:hypothetical protein
MPSNRARSDSVGNDARVCLGRLGKRLQGDEILTLEQGNPGCNVRADTIHIVQSSYRILDHAALIWGFEVSNIRTQICELLHPLLELCMFPKKPPHELGA